MLPKLSYEEALELLNKAVEKKGPDYVYPRSKNQNCKYFSGNTPSCIVGQVLYLKGVKAKEIKELNEASVALLRIAEDDRTESLLEQAQLFQDRGTPWGAAVKIAVEYVKRRGERRFGELDAS